jgi:polyhydroxyalkanoate synthase
VDRAHVTSRQTGFTIATNRRLHVPDVLLDPLRNLYALTLGDGIRTMAQTEHVVLHDEPHRCLRRYGSPDQLRAAQQDAIPPVLLVPPIAAPASCYDLDPDHSYVRHLLETGRIPYVIDFGDIRRSDRHLGFEHFALDIVPQAAKRMLEDYSDGGEVATELDLVAWSLGGTIGLLTVAADPDLPIRSITAIGTPLDYSLVPPYPLVRALMRPTKGLAATGLLRLLGGIPAPLVQIAYRATAWQRELKKPAFILRNLDDTDKLARMEVVNRFQRSFPGYPGRLAEQMWESFIYRGELATGVMEFGGRRIDLTTIEVPVQLFGSHRDAIVPWKAAHHGITLLAGSSQVHFDTVETSHLGLIAGPDAVSGTWPTIDAFLGSLSGESTSGTLEEGSG